MNSMHVQSDVRGWQRWLMSSSSETHLGLARVEIVGVVAAVIGIVLFVASH
ncbi:MAG TPA: hypothetical protein VF407_09115 [Polyangiaceae bacterium]